MNATSLIKYVVVCLLNISSGFSSYQEIINLSNFRIASITALCIYLVKSLPKHVLLITSNLIPCWNCGRGCLLGYQHVTDKDWEWQLGLMIELISESPLIHTKHYFCSLSFISPAAEGWNACIATLYKELHDQLHEKLFVVYQYKGK